MAEATACNSSRLYIVHTYKRDERETLSFSSVCVGGGGEGGRGKATTINKEINI